MTIHQLQKIRQINSKKSNITLTLNITERESKNIKLQKKKIIRKTNKKNTKDKAWI